MLYAGESKQPYKVIGALVSESHCPIRVASFKAMQKRSGGIVKMRDASLVGLPLFSAAASD